MCRRPRRRSRTGAARAAHRLAAGATAAPPRARGAIRLRLARPARAGRQGHRRPERRRGRVRAPHGGHAHPRVAARDADVRRRAVAAHPEPGRRAARPLRQRRLPALRPGHVVPRRAAAPLGADGGMARRRAALLARPDAVCRRARAAARHGRRCEAVHRGAGHAPRTGPQARDAGPRGSRVLPVARAKAAGQRRPVRLEARRRARTRAAAPRDRPEAGPRRLRVVARARVAGGGLGAEVDQRALVRSRRAAVPDPRRLADRLRPAAGLAAERQGRRDRVAPRARRVRAPRRVARCAGLRRAPRRPGSRRGRRGRAAWTGAAGTRRWDRRRRHAAMARRGPPAPATCR